MTLVRSAAAHRPVAHPASPPPLRKVAPSAAATAAARDLLVLSQGNAVSIGSFHADPARLTAFSKNTARFREMIFSAGMRLSREIPESPHARQSLRKLPAGASLSRLVFESAQVPQTVPPTAASRAERARAVADARVLAQALHRNGGDVYLANWNNQDDTEVNILAAVNRKTGDLTLVKLFPAI